MFSFFCCKEGDIIKIKVLNRTVKELEHIKGVKEKIKEVNNKNYNNVNEYAGNKIERGNYVVANENVYRVSNIGNNSLKNFKDNYKTTKDNIIKTKDSIVKLKGKIKSRNKGFKAVNKIKKKTKNKVVKKTTNTIKNSYKIKQQIKRISKGIYKSIKLAIKSIKAIITGTKALIELLIAGGWVVVLIIIILCIISLLFNSIFGIFYTNEGLDNSVTMSNVILTLNGELNNKIDSIKKANPNVECNINYNEANWKDILILYSVKQSGLDSNSFMAVLDDNKINNIKKIFWEMNTISSKIEEVEVGKKKLIITVTGKSLDEMITRYNLTSLEKTKVQELSSSKYDSLWNNVISGSNLSISINEGDYNFPVGGLYTITQYYHNGHKAIDIASNYGSNIYAISDGIVYLVKGGCIVGDLSCNGRGGNYVIIRHNDNRYYSVYMHLKNYVVKQNDKISKGQVIGYMGNTGNVDPVPTNSNSTNGTHLHFVLYDGIPYQGGVAINPNVIFKLK